MAAALTALFLIAGLSGCAGKEAKPAVASVSEIASRAPATTSLADANKDLKGVVDAKRHFHHYWGDRQQVDIFYRTDLALEQDPFAGSEYGCRSVGHRYFDLETDEDDATNEPGSNPVNPTPTSGPNPKADVVFAGTKRIDVTLLGQNLGVDPTSTTKVFFRYKPANLNFFQPDSSSSTGSCGIPLTKGQTISIPVSSQASDPPHQWAVSRWRFFVIVATQQAEGSPELPTIGQGTIGLQMTAINGGENNLDPAHPDLWGTSLTYDLGCKKGTTDHQVVLQGLPEEQLNQEPKDPLSDIAPSYGRIVPLLTQKVVVTVDYRYTGTVPGTTLDLQYAGADTNKYVAPPGTPTHEGSKWTYEIPDEKGIKADPPYLDKSLWRFRLVPHGPATDAPSPAPKAAEFTGDFELCATAFRDPTAVLT